MKRYLIYRFVCICMVVGFFGSVFVNAVYSMDQGASDKDRVISKETVQENTHELLQKLDDLPSENTKSLYALFTDQDPKNISGYATRYCKATALIKGLRQNRDDWRKLLKQNKHDKVYLAFQSTVQLALYSIYNRRGEFLTFLKFYNEYLHRHECSFRRNECPLLGDDESRRDWDEMHSDWDINASSSLNRASASISKALKIDEYYRDTRILKAQVLVFQEKYDEALELYQTLETEGLFEENESLVASWRAYISFQKNDHKGVVDNLRYASASSEPYNNATWASRYLRIWQKKTKKNRWIVFGFSDVQLHEDKDTDEDASLSGLVERTEKVIDDIKVDFAIPLVYLPGHVPTREEMSLLVQKNNIYQGLEGNKMPDNINKYKGYISNIYKNGEKLKEIIDDWDKLIKDNNSLDDESVSNFYRMYKVKSSMVLLEIINGTSGIVNNQGFENAVKSGQGKKIDYARVWRDWTVKIKDSLDSDIKQIVSVENPLMSAEILAFEYKAIISGTVTSTEKLRKIFTKHKAKEIDIGTDKLKKDNYIALWDAYFALEKDDLVKAGKFLNQADGLEDWKRKEFKILYMNQYSKKSGSRSAFHRGRSRDGDDD